MRFLILASQPPYPQHGGGALRISGLLQGIAQAGHSIDLLTFAAPGTVDPGSTPAAAWCNRIIAVSTPRRTKSDRLRDLLLTAKPDLAGRFYSEAFSRQLQVLLTQAADPDSRYDVIQMESLEMCAYMDQVTAYRDQHDTRLIYDSFNAEYNLQRVVFQTDINSPRRWPIALYSLIQWHRLRGFERSVCETIDHVIAVSEPDAADFKRLAPSARVTVVPNGIHVSEYAQAVDHSESPPHSPTVLFTGTLNYRPNVDAVLWLARDIWPLIVARIPSALLQIVGKSPVPAITALDDRSNIQVSPNVADIRPFIQSCAVYVCPLRMGSGTRLKLLQALSARRAVVSTGLGAAGLNGVSGQHLIIADSAAAFAEAVIDLLNDPARRAALGSSGYDLVSTEYNWPQIWPRLLSVYDQHLQTT